jgi:hypothetical protein
VRAALAFFDGAGIWRAPGAAIALVPAWPLLAGLPAHRQDVDRVRIAIDSQRGVSPMTDYDPIRRRLARIAWLLDNSIPLPGVKFRIGLDAILGLIPGLGDVLGVILSSYIVREAARLGAPPSLLARMAWNVAIEGIVGMVPFLGDIFDAAWKANQRNYLLLEEHLDNPRRAARSSRLFVALLIVGLITFVLLLAGVGFLIVRAIAHAIGT